MKLVFVCLTLLLAGCGQTGALYLPEERATEVEATPPASDADKERKKEPTTTTPPVKDQ